MTDHKRKWYMIFINTSHQKQAHWNSGCPPLLGCKLSSGRNYQNPRLLKETLKQKGSLSLVVNSSIYGVLEFVTSPLLYHMYVDLFQMKSKHTAESIVWAIATEL